MNYPDGYDVQHFPTLESTNSFLKAEAEKGVPDGRVIIADQQSGGRGRRGNHWVSPQGNLYLSLLKRIAVPAKQAGQLSFLTSVAMLQAIEKSAGTGMQDGDILQQKWPNDILVQGHKISGILLESEVAGSVLKWLVIGIGVNIQSAPKGAIALNDITKTPVSRDDLAVHFLREFDNLFKDYQHAGFNVVRTLWKEKAAYLGGIITVRLATETLKGRFIDIDMDGQLVLEDETGRQKFIASGDVFFG